MGNEADDAIAKAIEAEFDGAGRSFARGMAIVCVTETRFLAALATMPGRGARDELRRNCPQYAHLAPESP